MTTESDTNEIIGLREFAELVGVSHASLREAIKLGRISPASVCTITQGTRTLTKLYKERASADWRAVHSQRPGIKLSDDDIADAQSASKDGVQWGIVKTRNEAIVAGEKAKLLRCERMELEGKLHRAEDVETVWGDVLIRFRTRIMAIPSAVAPIVCSMPNPEPADVQTVIEAHLHEALSELAQYDGSRIDAERKRRSGK